jgi:mycothiol synthase
MTSTDISILSFTWADVPAVAALQAGVDPASTPPQIAADGLRRWLAQPGMQPEHDGFVARMDGGVVGWSYLVAEPSIRRGVHISDVAPSADAALTNQALLAAATLLARKLDYGVLHADVPEANVQRKESLAAAGLVHVRTHNHLRRTDTGKVGVPVPSGGTLRLAEPADVVAVTELQNAAFSGSWGFAPNTAEEIGYRVFELPNDPPDAVVLLHMDGELVGYNWTEREGANGPGIVSMVGIRPDLQGRGLGRVVTAAGLDHLVDVGATPIDITVDSANTPAVKLYESLGFTPEWRSFWYELSLD